MEMFLVSGPSSYCIFSYEKTTLLLKVVDVRTSGCTVRCRQGCAGGAAADAEWELPVGSSAATNQLR